MPIQWDFEGPLKPPLETTNKKNFIGWAIGHMPRPRDAGARTAAAAGMTCSTGPRLGQGYSAAFSSESVAVSPHATAR